jgi:hypothetical protein
MLPLERMCLTCTYVLVECPQSSTYYLENPTRSAHIVPQREIGVTSDFTGVGALQYIDKISLAVTVRARVPLKFQAHSRTITLLSHSSATASAQN